MILLLSTTSHSIPEPPAEFFGKVIINGKYAAADTIIEITDGSGVLCGTGKVKDKGKYGYISCRGDDLTTIADEGAIDGEGLKFFVNNTKIKTEPYIFWSSGSFSEVNLVVGDVVLALPLLEEPASNYVSNVSQIILFLTSISIFVLVSIKFTGWMRKVKKKKEESQIEDN